MWNMNAGTMVDCGVCFKYASSKLQVCFKYDSCLFQVYVRYASNMNQVWFKYASYSWMRGHLRDLVSHASDQSMG
jgi:hypothetical protein